MTNRVIFDFGANKGQNIEYFLRKSDLVVAVEPVPEFCEVIIHKFPNFIGNKLIVINAFVTNEENDGKSIAFFVSKYHPGLSTFLDRRESHDFTEIQVATISASSIIKSILKEDDVLEYVKIDCEGADELILDSLICSGLVPHHLSVELHSEAVFKLVTGLEQFVNFRIENAGRINSQFLGISPRRIVKFLTLGNGHRRNTTLHFSPISSGPFGNDLIGRWYSRRAIDGYFMSVGTGPKDIHASQTRMSGRNDFSSLGKAVQRLNRGLKSSKLRVKNQLRRLLPNYIYSFLIFAYGISRHLSLSGIRRERIRKMFINFK